MWNLRCFQVLWLEVCHFSYHLLVLYINVNERSVSADIIKTGGFKLQIDKYMNGSAGEQVLFSVT